MIKDVDKYYQKHKDEIDKIDIRVEVRRLAADSIALHEAISALQSLKNDGRKAINIDDMLALIFSFIDMNRMKLKEKDDVSR